jgi:hypothetical protein
MKAEKSLFEEYLNQQGIIHETTAPYTHAQNGKSERVNRIDYRGYQILF